MLISVIVTHLMKHCFEIRQNDISFRAKNSSRLLEPLFDVAQVLNAISSCHSPEG